MKRRATIELDSGGWLAVRRASSGTITVVQGYGETERVMRLTREEAFALASALAQAAAERQTLPVP